MSDLPHQHFVEVAVEGVLPGPDSLTLTYATERELEIGTLVWVPLRRSVALGVVLASHQIEPEFNVKPLLDVVDGFSMRPEQIDLARWLQRECASDLFSCLALMLPPGVKLSVTPWFEARGGQTGSTKMQEQVLEHLRLNGTASLEQLQTAIGSTLSTVLKDLERTGAVTRRYTSNVRTVQSRTESWWRVNSGTSTPKLTARQSELHRLVLAAGPDGMRANEARDRTGVSASVAAKLIENGAMVVEQRPLEAQLEIEPSGPIPVLTDEQQEAWSGIADAIESGRSSPQLLFGVTGSGKTEIYLRAIARTLRLGKQAIYLVPEIALTSHIVGRVKDRFPGQVAVLHSGLAMGARQEAWDAVASGERRIVVGTRSALLAPVPALGLIVIDEEHDTSYKQDAVPRYDARSLAEEVARRASATIILGSATPRIETLWRTTQNQVTSYRLSQRAVAGARELPPIQIVDIRQELQAGHTALLSRPLIAAVESALERREQTMLMLNRRGMSTVVICRDCGSSLNCPNCDIPMVFHRDRASLICHRCDHRERPPVNCPKVRWHARLLWSRYAAGGDGGPQAIPECAGCALGSGHRPSTWCQRRDSSVD